MFTKKSKPKFPKFVIKKILHISKQALHFIEAIGIVYPPYKVEFSSVNSLGGDSRYLHCENKYFFEGKMHSAQVRKIADKFWGFKSLFYGILNY